MLTTKIIKKIKMSFNTLLILFLALQFTACSNIGERSDELLAQISNYEIGQNRSKLAEYNQLVVQAAKSKSESESVEESILLFLQSDATFDSKQFACRELRIIGSEKSVPVLSILLKDENTADIARYSLESIPGDKVDGALLQALEEGTKKIKLGVINTLAIRESKSAVVPIAKFIKSDDLDMAEAALSALGKIKGDESIKFLSVELNNSNKRLQNLAADSYLHCVADIAVNNPKEANKIYTDLYGKEISLPNRQAALVGMINTSQNKDEVIYNSIINDNNALKYVAIEKIRELPSDHDISKFTKLLTKAAPENQIQLLGIIKDRSDKSAKKHVIRTLKSTEPLVRIASLQALKNIGSENEVLIVAMIAASRTGNERRAARECLDQLNDDKANNIIVSNIPLADEKVKIELIRAAGERSINSAFDVLLDNINSDDRQIRTASYSALSEISTNENLQVLTEKLFELKIQNDRKKMERIISQVLMKYSDAKYAEYLANNYETLNSIEKKCSSLRLLGYTNNPSALATLRQNVKSDDQQIKIAAIEGLSNWSTSETLYDLLEATEKAENDEVKQPALKGFTNFVTADRNLSDLEKIKLYEKALKYAKTGNEKNLALNGIGHIDNFESLEVLKLHYKDPLVKRTVEDGINRVCWHIASSDPARVQAFIMEIMEITTDENYLKKSQHVIDMTNKLLKQ